jgi:hypothetical protein
LVWGFFPKPKTIIRNGLMVYKFKSAHNVVFKNIKVLSLDDMVEEFEETDVFSIISMVNDSMGPGGCVVVISGTFCLGKYSDVKVRELISKLDDKMKSLDSKLLMLRGLHDPERFFHGTFNTDNVILLEDYSVIQTTKCNYLCIGGNLSLDREWLEERGEYEPTEVPVYDEEKIVHAIVKYKANALFTNMVPPIFKCGDFYAENVWLKNDEKLWSDYFSYLEMMMKVFMMFVKHKTVVRDWICCGSIKDQISHETSHLPYGGNVISPIEPFFTIPLGRRIRMEGIVEVRDESNGIGAFYDINHDIINVADLEV